MPRRKDLRRQQRDEARAIVLAAAQSGDKAKAKTAILAARLMESIDSEFVQEGWRERATAAEARVRQLEQRVQELEKQVAPKPKEEEYKGFEPYYDQFGRMRYR